MRILLVFASLILFCCCKAQVCFNGYVMDEFCIDLGFLLDTGDVSLEFPDRHTIHCVVDVGVCRNSGFWILRDREPGEALYEPIAKLDEAGNAMLIDYARRIGACTTCVNGYRSGQVEGLRATVVGTMMEDGETLMVSQIEEDGVSCESLLQVDPTMPPTTTPTGQPTTSPTPSPTSFPTLTPTQDPTPSPTPSPTSFPTSTPTLDPSPSPTMGPTASPTVFPTISPTLSPTADPTTPSPTPPPTTITTPPSGEPTMSPTTMVPTPGQTPITASPTMVSPSLTDVTITTPSPTAMTNPTSQSTFADESTDSFAPRLFGPLIVFFVPFVIIIF